MEGELESKNDLPDGESEDQHDDQSKTDHDDSDHIEEEKIDTSSVTRKLETLIGNYHFTLSGYSRAKGIGAGQYFSSGTFAVGGHNWAVYFYPDGKAAEDQSEFVSVFIALASDSFDVQALFEIILLDQSGRGLHMIHSHFDGQIESPYTLERQGSMWGYNRYFRRDSLEVSDYLKDDTLEFTGRVGVLLSSIKPTILTTTTIIPPLQLNNLEDNQSSGDDESLPQDKQVIGSQSEGAIVSKVKGLRLEDELAKYHLKLLNTQSPIRVGAKLGTGEAPPAN
ncbi:unnamed protein product [Calypogeia fissa]